MKKSLLLVMVVVFLATTIGMAFAGPFSDVPKKHWAYEAVNSLAAKGLLEGYADGKFKGAKAMTRYEMALMVARLIDKKFGGADLETLQKLTIEFADELALLGVKVQALEEEVKVMRNDVDAAKADIDMLKKGGLGKIKLSVEDRIRWDNYKIKPATIAVANYSRMQNRFRMNMKANIDDNVTAFFSYQDTTVHNSNVQNNTFGNLLPTADVSQRNLFLGYVDIKNFGGNNIVDNFRIGRFTLTLGKGFILDNEIDGIQMKKNYRGTNFSLAFLDTRGANLGLFTNANDGMNTKLFTVDHAWKNVAAGLYYLTSTNVYAPVTFATNLGTTGANMMGLTLDGKLGKNVVAFLEYADQTPAKDKANYAGAPDTTSWKGQGMKLGAEWTINPTWDLTLLYQDRAKDFRVVGVNDDYSDSAYYGNFCLIGNDVSSYNNSKIASLIVGYKATNKLHLDVWYEDFKGKTKAAVTNFSGNVDQTSTQLVGTYQYRENTAFKLRYRTTKYKTGDVDYAAGLGTGYDQVRLDMNVKF